VRSEKREGCLLARGPGELAPTQQVHV
jgi:hypothetical protein